MDLPYENPELLKLHWRLFSASLFCGPNTHLDLAIWHHTPLNKHYKLLLRPEPVIKYGFEIWGMICCIHFTHKRSITALKILFISCMHYLCATWAFSKVLTCVGKFHLVSFFFFIIKKKCGKIKSIKKLCSIWSKFRHVFKYNSIELKRSIHQLHCCYLHIMECSYTGLNFGRLFSLTTSLVLWL